ncbi:MAG: hypothetical protein AB7E36_15795 [Salinivirgaceae bacterium]
MIKRENGGRNTEEGEGAGGWLLVSGNSIVTLFYCSLAVNWWLVAGFLFLEVRN